MHLLNYQIPTYRSTGLQWRRILLIFVRDQNGIRAGSSSQSFHTNCCSIEITHIFQFLQPSTRWNTDDEISKHWQGVIKFVAKYFLSHLWLASNYGRNWNINFFLRHLNQTIEFQRISLLPAHYMVCVFENWIMVHVPSKHATWPVQLT